jgi:hypothetical protein
MAIVDERHRLPFQGKSEFDSFSLIDDAIAESVDANAIVGANGNLIVVVNFGHEVGFDAQRNRRTELATVVLDSRTGEVITVFPGRPGDNSFPLPRI